MSETELRKKLIRQIMHPDENRLKNFSTEKLKQINGLLFTEEKTYDIDKKLRTITIFSSDTKDAIETKIAEKHDMKCGTIYVDMLDGNAMYCLLDMFLDGDCYDLHSSNGIICDHVSMAEIAEKLYTIRKEMTDKAVVAELNNLTLDSKVYMTVHNKRKLYAINKQCDDSYDMEVIDVMTNKEDEMTVYGMSCEGIADIISVLLADYVHGIIQDIQIVQ